MVVNVRKGLQTVKQVALYAGLILGALGNAPSAMAVGGTPAYEVESTSFQWIDATVAPTTTTVPIGFDFKFYGVSRNSLMIAGAGYLALGTDPSNYNNTISPYHSAFYTSPNQRIYTRTDGAAPNRRFTVSWINLAYGTYVDPDCGCSPEPFGSVSFQATLYEGSNDIVFRYLDTIANDEGPNEYPVDNGILARVGLINPDGSGGTLYSNNQAVIFSGTALRLFIGTNLSPIANAGADQSVNEGTSVALNGGSSSDNGTIATYAWAQYRPFPYTYPFAPIVTLATPDTVVSHFVAPQLTSEPSPTTLNFQLTVTDNKRAYTIDTMKVDVLDLNVPPTVTLGPDITVATGATVRLTAVASDPNGTVAQYIWSQYGGTNVSWIGAGTPSIMLTAPESSDPLKFVVTVIDNEGAGGRDDILITVSPPPTPPIANAGPDQIVKQKTTVTLNGSGSSDADGNIVSYKWRQVSGKTVTLKSATSAKATFTAPSTILPSKLTFELTVTDNSGSTAKDQVVVVVTNR